MEEDGKGSDMKTAVWDLYDYTKGQHIFDHSTVEVKLHAPL